MTPVALSLGSSMGDRMGRLRLATATLRAWPGVRLLRAARVIATTPVGGVAHRVFYNSVLVVETTLAPEPLLDVCKHIERRLGRRPARSWADRVIDIDILLYGDQHVATPRLTIPHPQLPARPFFLALLAEVWPAPILSGPAQPDPAPLTERWPVVGLCHTTRPLVR